MFILIWNENFVDMYNNIIDLEYYLCKVIWDFEILLESILFFLCKFYIFRWCVLVFYNKLWIIFKRVRRLDGFWMCNIWKFISLYM